MITFNGSTLPTECVETNGKESATVMYQEIGLQAQKAPEAFVLPENRPFMDENIRVSPFVKRQ
jgi:hypothetical protein